jgi:hypothetical protein
MFATGAVQFSSDALRSHNDRVDCMFHVRGLDGYKYWYLSDYNAGTEDCDAYSWQVPAVAVIRLHAFSKYIDSKSGLRSAFIFPTKMLAHLYSRYFAYSLPSLASVFKIQRRFISCSNLCFDTTQHQYTCDSHQKPSDFSGSRQNYESCWKES